MHKILEFAHLHCSRVSGKHNGCSPVEMISVQLLHVLYQASLQVIENTLDSCLESDSFEFRLSLHAHTCCTLKALLDARRLYGR